MCNNLDKEYSERTQTWTEMIPAVQETSGILTDNDVHVLFSLALGFILLSSCSRRVSGMEMAKETKDPQLVALAMGSRLDANGMLKKGEGHDRRPEGGGR